MESRRVVFLGNDPWSVPSLEALARSSHDVALTITRTPRPAPRGRALVPTPVAEAARRLELPFLETDTVRAGEGLEAVRAAAPDVLVVVAYGEILTGDVLAVPRIRSVNVHFSLLPALRGAAPVQHALLEGHQVTGVTTMVMDPGLDTGPVLLQREEAIRPEDDAGSLGDRLATIGAELLVETMDRLDAIEPRSQDASLATYAPKLRPEDRWIDWTRPAEGIARWVRALAPGPGASTRFRGDVLKVLRVSADAGEGVPGTVTGVDAGGPVIGAGEGLVRLLEVVPAGRSRMSGAEFARGHRPRRGERLG